MVYGTIRRHLRWAANYGGIVRDFKDYLEISKTMTLPARLSKFETSFEQLLKLRRGSQCKDPRDLVYSLLGIPHTKVRIEPDYSMSIRDVFTSTTRQIITTTQSLSIIGEINTETFNSLPTWVPDWRERKSETFFSLRQDEWRLRDADSGLGQMSPSNLEPLSDASHLHIHGLCVDEIEAQVQGGDLDAAFNLFKRQKFYHYTKTDELTEVAILRTMALDSCDEERVHKSPVSHGRWRHSFKPEDFYDTSFRDNDASVFWRTSGQEKFFRSNEAGFMGLGPGRAERGDIICIIWGIGWPVLLRPSGNEYLFVGHYYVYGLMCGRTGLLQARRKKRGKKPLSVLIDGDEDTSTLWGPPEFSEMQEFILK